jgi:CheY-like chemotaxis protein
MAIRLVPEALVRRHRILPLTEDGVSIEVATDNPTDLTAELAIRHVTGRRVVFRIAPPDELREALKHLPSASSPEAPRSDEAHSAVAGTTVLLVDDDEEARLLVRALLEGKGGFRILEASDGEEGLERLDRDDSIHLVVVDLSMPRMGGREMLRALRALPLRTQPSVIVVTGAGDPRLEADLIEDGADDYIRKPLDPRLFLARVTATLRRAGI